MVILQFNKLIRNKWVWGVFAVIISLAFCFEDLFSAREREDRQSGGAGTLAGEKVDAELFSDIVQEIRGFGRQRDTETDQGEVNRNAWEMYASIVVADKGGLTATDQDVQDMIRRDPSFQANGAFSFARYRQLLLENGLSPERFESYLKRRLTLMRVGESVLGSAAWASPMELDMAVSDMTDEFTVKVARFAQSKKEADMVKVDENMMKKWYAENTNSIALPDRMKIRYVKFDATDAKVLAKMSVSENDMRDHYDVTVDKYTSTDTNGVETVKKFEEVKAEIEKELRLIAAVQYFETNVTARAYGQKAKKGSSRLDEIAKEDSLKVETSDWFTLDNRYVDGFMTYKSLILPGAQNFESAVAELDSSSEDLRYGIVTSPKAVWLIEKVAEDPKHVPTFDEAKKAIEPKVLRAAKADAFKAKVEAIAAKGVKEILASGKVSTNLTFTVADLKDRVFPDQTAITRAAMKLKKGEVSKFTLTSTGNALLVICEERKEGDAAKAMIVRSQVLNDVSMIQRRQIPESWRKWNLERMGFQPGEISSVETVKEEE